MEQSEPESRLDVFARHANLSDLSDGFLVLFGWRPNLEWLTIVIGEAVWVRLGENFEADGGVYPICDVDPRFAGWAWGGGSMVFRDTEGGLDVEGELPIQILCGVERDELIDGMTAAARIVLDTIR